LVKSSPTPAVQRSGPVAAVPARPKTLGELEREHIVSAVESAGGKIDGPGGAAEMLGLHPNTLRSRMEKLGIVRPRRARP
ncbi:MAG TPA: helix-turn-helix domain-containing protein, partial [Polyangiaceae bacterium]